MRKKTILTKHKYTILAIASKLINTFVILKLLTIVLSDKDFINYILFLNSSTIFQFIFTLGLTTGLITYSKEPRIYNDFFILISISISILIVLLTVNSIYKYSNTLIIITSFFISLKIISLSILNGLNNKKDFSIYCFLDSAIIILLTIYLNYKNINENYIYSYLISSSIVFILFLVKIKNLKLSFKKNRLVSFYLRYKSFFYMSFFSAFIVPSFNLLIREKISTSNHTNLDIATILAGWRLNESLLMVIGTISTVYLIQKFCAITIKKNQINKIKKDALCIFLLSLILILITLSIPDLFIKTILSERYSKNYFIFVFLFFSFSIRAYSYIIGLYLVINKKTSYFISIELIHILSLYIYISYFINYSMSVISCGFILQSFTAFLATNYYLNRVKK